MNQKHKYDNREGDSESFKVIKILKTKTCHKWRLDLLDHTSASCCLCFLSTVMGETALGKLKLRHRKKKGPECDEKAGVI